MKSGYALITVMFVMFIMIMTSTVGFNLAHQRVFSARLEFEKAQALSLAEAGVSDMVAIFLTEGALDVPSSFTNNYHGGTCYVSQELVSNGDTLIRSSAEFRRVKKDVALVLLGDPLIDLKEFLETDGCILCGGDLVLESSAPRIHGNIFVNGDAINERGNPTIDGNLTVVGKNGLIPSGSVFTNASPIYIPEFYLGLWKLAAMSGGFYYDTSQEFGGVDLMPPNGVVYVEGDVTIGQRSSLHGTLVASGSITIDNHFDQTSFNASYPSLLAGTDVCLNNRNNYYGVIFARNSIISRNNKTINGAFISGGSILVDGQCKLYPLPLVPIMSPYPELEPIRIRRGPWVK